jgi:Immunity protein 40
VLIPESYLNFKKTRGRSLHEIGVAEVAFTRPDALDALQALKGSQAGVLGGDVLKLVNGKPQYTYDNWHVHRAPNEDVWDFLMRSITETENYIRNYPDTEDETILYSLVVSELGV